MPERRRGVSAVDFRMSLFVASLVASIGIATSALILIILGVLLLVIGVAGRVATIRKIEKGEW
jgi:hypothetical protein